MKLFIDCKHSGEINSIKGDIFFNLNVTDVHKLSDCCLNQCIEIEVDEDDYIGLNGKLICQLPVWVVIGKFIYKNVNCGKIFDVSPFKIKSFVLGKKKRDELMETNRQGEDLFFKDIEIKMFMISY